MTTVTVKMGDEEVFASRPIQLGVRVPAALFTALRQHWAATTTRDVSFNTYVTAAIMEWLEEQEST